MGHRVATVVTAGANPFEFAAACEVFGLDRHDLGVDWYDFDLCSDRRRVPTSAGFDLLLTAGLEAVTAADTVIVPHADPDRPCAPALRRALVDAHARGARMVSFCSGAFALAAAGVLDDRRATTHWMLSERLARDFPAVDVDPFVLYVDAGDVLTSAGTAAGIDLGLHIVRRDFGAEVASAVARRMVVPPHRDGGQAQYVRAPVPTCADTDTLGPALEHVIEHLDEDWPVQRMAEQTGYSERTFARRFRAAVGTTPLQWITAQRVQAAAEALETTDDPVEVVASSTGFGSAASLRQHFERALATTPTAYRRTFRG